ncbi:Mitochondrial ornithine carrier protein AmcA/Ort1, putative, partial [Tolypocladium paradoxum]
RGGQGDGVLPVQPVPRGRGAAGRRRGRDDGGQRRERELPGRHLRRARGLWPRRDGRRQGLPRRGRGDGRQPAGEPVRHVQAVVSAPAGWLSLFPCVPPWWRLTRRRCSIREFCDMDMPIIMFDKNEDYVVLTLEQLLPLSFGPDHLARPGAPGTV